jgi:uncharacterized protein YoaH (UPF0181 family)
MAIAAKYLIVIFSVVLAACSSAQKSVVKTQLNDKDKIRVSAARHSYQQCVVQKVSELDDGVSSAFDVAMVVAKACRREREAEYAIVSESGVSAYYLQGYRSAGEKDAEADCAEAVLYWRQHARNAASDHR